MPIDTAPLRARFGPGLRLAAARLLAGLTDRVRTAAPDAVEDACPVTLRVEQDFDVRVLPAPGEEGRTHRVRLVVESTRLPSDPTVLRARQLLARRRQGFLEKCARSGVVLDGRPHSPARIDAVVPGQVRVTRMGPQDAGGAA